MAKTTDLPALHWDAAREAVRLGLMPAAVTSAEHVHRGRLVAELVKFIIAASRDSQGHDNYPALYEALRKVIDYGSESMTHEDALAACVQAFGHDDQARAANRKIVDGIDAPTLAIMFHNAYERLAPSYGYETRQETRKFDPDSANGRLMIATCAAILQELAEGADHADDG